MFALIHCDVPASSRAFLSQLLTNLQMIGRWSDSKPHPKQNACPAPHLTVGTTVASDDRFADVQGSSTRAQKNARNRRLVRELKRGDRVNVKIQPLCLFLFRDGTVVTIHPGALGEGEKQGCGLALTSGR